uniref:G-protein coupled receptors family 1 profile domain-containing protein n=1 Tax=Cercocebus atys TaxID=9531 RepID=A0A2K5NFJ0_CERAT
MALPITNGTLFMPFVLTFIGIPGLESVQCWIGIPFCAMYIIALIGNSLVLIIIKSEPSLQEPMYIFLAMLGATDISLSTSIVPKMLGIFWFHLPEIYFDACLFQMWLIHTFQGIESGILLAMALGCYVVICYPLRHAMVFTRQLVTYIVVGVTLRPAILVIPHLLLIKCRLKIYRTKLISHTYCEHMALVKLATEDVYINKFYGIFGAFMVGGLDFIIITLTYIQVFITVFHLPLKEVFNTCIIHICIWILYPIICTHHLFQYLPSSPTNPQPLYLWDKDQAH